MGGSKTDAGIRSVDIVPVLQDELTAHRAIAKNTQRGGFVFPTSTGSRRDKDNARTRVIADWAGLRKQKAQQMLGFQTMGAAGFEPATSRV